jgi:hypothetical protein
MDKKKLLQNLALLNGYVDHELLDQHHQNRDVSQPLENLYLRYTLYIYKFSFNKHSDIYKIS